jgi:hypothetical protein
MPELEDEKVLVGEREIVSRNHLVIIYDKSLSDTNGGHFYIHTLVVITWHYLTKASESLLLEATANDGLPLSHFALGMS